MVWAIPRGPPLPTVRWAERAALAASLSERALVVTLLRPFRTESEIPRSIAEDERRRGLRLF